MQSRGGERYGGLGYTQDWRHSKGGNPFINNHPSSKLSRRHLGHSKSSAIGHQSGVTSPLRSLAGHNRNPSVMSGHLEQLVKPLSRNDRAHLSKSIAESTTSMNQLKNKV
jgi:hypothetical protein